MQPRRSLVKLGEHCKATCLVLAQHGSWILQMSQCRYGMLMPFRQPKADQALLWQLAVQALRLTPCWAQCKVRQLPTQMSRFHARHGERYVQEGADAGSRLAAFLCIH